MYGLPAKPLRKAHNGVYVGSSGDGVEGHR